MRSETEFISCLMCAFVMDIQNDHMPYNVSGIISTSDEGFGYATHGLRKEAPNSNGQREQTSDAWDCGSISSTSLIHFSFRLRSAYEFWMYLNHLHSYRPTTFSDVTFEHKPRAPPTVPVGNSTKHAGNCGKAKRHAFVDGSEISG